MKIYEKPSVEIKKFDVEDIITASIETEISIGTTSSDLQTITGDMNAVGVVFEW